MEQLKSGAQRDQSATKTEINKRFSFPFSCIAFALIGVPLGITTHRRETSVGFATGLIVAIFYFLFIIIADTMRANASIHPELLVWFPNVLFIVIGAWLFRRLSRQLEMDVQPDRREGCGRLARPPLHRALLRRVASNPDNVPRQSIIRAIEIHRA